MTNKEKANELSIEIAQEYDRKDVVGYECAVKMAEWKDKQMWLLIDAIDYVYLQTDGSYRDLSPVVSDKIRFLKETCR